MTQDELRNKYRQDDIVFGTKWFQKHQSKLLWLLNTPIISVWFRYCLRIRKYDCNTTINQITPNSFSYNAKRISKKKIQLTTDFRTHDKYSKRLYFAFKPFWYILHFFDWAMLDRIKLASKLSFGFSTLTQYPESIGTDNPVDGTVRRSGVDESWATIRAGAGTNVTLGSSQTEFYFIRILCSATTNQFAQIYRSIFCFDTSTLTAGATISAAVLSLWGMDKQDIATAITPNIDIYTATPAVTNNLATGDYGQIGTTSQTGSPITYANFDATDSVYTDFTFSATGRGNISKTGVSSFGARNANYDVSGTTPTWANGSNHYLDGAFSGTAGTTKDPKLVVTYTAVLPNYNFFAFFN